LKVSAAQSKAQTKEGKETGEIWGTKELRPYFTEGAAEIAKDENRRGVGGVVHGDFKMDNLVCFFSFTWKSNKREGTNDRSSTPPNLVLLEY
jgi:hypothetical protein